MRRLIRCAVVVVCAIFVLSSATSAGQQQMSMQQPMQAQMRGDHLTPEDIFHLQYTSDPQISPDGKRIVYVRTSANIMTDTRETNLWIVNFDGTDDRALTSGHDNDIRRDGRLTERASHIWRGMKDTRNFTCVGWIQAKLRG